uniref:F-box/LRR-repeat protein 2 n=1 Tax=Ceratitis capitata TaxID=7213 RepID=W8CDM9_CERCA
MSSDTDSELARAAAAMLSLNNDCLERIFSYLDLPEQIRFARINQRFREGFKEYAKRAHKVCDLYKISLMSIYDIREFFQLAGENIQKITRETEFRTQNSMFPWLGEFCTQLRELNLSNCSLNDESIIWLQNLNNLEILAIANNREISGTYLSGLVHLTELNLCGCIHVQQEALIEMFKALTKLKRLDIRGCLAITSEFLPALTTFCRELEVLKMSCSRFSYEFLALLPRLKELMLLDRIFSPTRKTRLLDALVAIKSNQLESLEMYQTDSLHDIHFTFISQIRSLKKLAIDFNAGLIDSVLNKFGNLKQLETLSITGCKNMSAQGLLNLLRNCPRLHSLNIQHCDNIETKFVLDVIPILHDESAEREKPFKLFVFETRIAQVQLAEKAHYLEAVEKSLIKIVFNNVDLKYI